MNSDSYTHVFIDGPNIDMVLGSILGRVPLPHERPRWQRVHAYCRTKLQCARPTFVLNGNRFTLNNSGVLALYRVLKHDMGYDVECPCGSSGDPVDEFIKLGVKTAARFNRPPSVAIFSHDHGYAPDLSAILMQGGTVSVIGFPEEMSSQLVRLQEQGAIIVDLERDIGAFDISLPRPPLTRFMLSERHGSFVTPQL